MNTRMLTRVALILAIALSVSHAYAVNKCTGKDGKIVYQDAPCNNSATGSQSIKTWDNTPGSYHGQPRSRAIEPDEKLEGPPQVAKLLQLYRRWIDAEKLAASTARIAVAQPVSALQVIHREVEALTVASCATDSKKALVSLTKRSVDTMIQFMQKQELAGMVYQFLDRPTLVSEFEQSIKLTSCKA